MPYDQDSYWNATAPAPEFPRLKGEVRADIAIIGGGLVGVTTARLLKDKGLRVALVEARRVGREVTGRSTAKVTSQHYLAYQVLERKFGADKARLYGQVQETALRKIKALAREHAIDCDFEARTAFTYTRDKDHVERLQKEAEIAQRLGLPARFVRESDLPFDILGAVRFDYQAQFHPTRYVAGLAETIPGDGCQVFEQSRVVEWEPDRITTENGTVRANHVVMATHLPLGQVGGYYAKAHPHAEPVIAAPIPRAPEGMYLSSETPRHSLRTHRGADGTLYAIAAGTSFKPGHTDDERRYFADIEGWLTANFDAGPIRYRWVNEDYSSMDQAPFIGWSPGKSYLVATGFSAWGITNGTAAGMILADLAAGQDHPWTDLFDADRIKPVAGAAEFVSENAGVAAHLVGGYLARKLDSVEALAPGEAAILKLDGKNIAAFRDEGGALHTVSAVCSHMGCLVGWNETDRTWDCPCHGSRFALDGSVIHGPATRPLGSKLTG